MWIQYSLSDFASFLEVLISIAFVLAGFVLAASALKFRSFVEGHLSDGTIQSAFNHRNDSRRLFARFLWFGSVLLVIRLAAGALKVPPCSQWASVVCLGLSAVALAALGVLLVRTYAFYFRSTTIKGSGTV